MNINQKHESKRRDMPSACFDGNHFSVKTHWKHAEGISLRYGVIFFRYGWGQKNPLRGGCHTGGDI